MIAVFAVTVRGLEQLCAGEMARLGATITETGYRRVHAGISGDPGRLLALSTADDLFVEISRWSGIGHTRAALEQLQALAEALPLRAGLAQCARLRPIGRHPLFSVTANFVGRRNYSADEIKGAVSAGIEAGQGWRYTPDDREAELNVRLFIEQTEALIGLRLGAAPLHRRGYKQEQRPGSLKPTVAAAMLELLRLQPGERLLDPCCGAGTILIEAGRRGALVQGGDMDAEAVSASLANGASAGVGLAVERWDARSLPLPGGAVQAVACNLPWDRQTAIKGAAGGGAAGDETDKEGGKEGDMGIDREVDEATFYADVCAEMERVLIPGGRLALLTNRPELLRFARMECQRQIEISLFGQRPVIGLYASAYGQSQGDG